jgi:hypothetical protein
VSLLTLWSPKGGSGTSVLAAACSLVLARHTGARLVDLAGDQPAILGLGADPSPGVAEWLAMGPRAPTDALERISVEVAPGLALLPMGEEPSGLAPAARAEAGAALAVALRDAALPTVVDAGTAGDAAARALLEVSDVSIVVLRECYVALRRASRLPLVGRAAGLVVVQEAGRALGPREISDVLGRAVLSRVPIRDTIARAVDAGSLPSRVPEPLARPVAEALRAIGFGVSRRGAAA